MRALLAGIAVVLVPVVVSPLLAAVQLVIVSPRETRVLSSQLKFVWTGGPETGKYSVHVLGPNGMRWTADDARTGIPYPDSAPKLVPGVRYRWEVRMGDTRSERAHFEIVSDREWGQIQTQLAALSGSGSPTNLTLARVALLFQERLYQTALEELQTAIVENKAEPNLHFMLGHVYDRMGLREQAVAAFGEGQRLSAD